MLIAAANLIVTMNKVSSFLTSLLLLLVSFFLFSAPTQAINLISVTPEVKAQQCNEVPPAEYEGPQYYVADPENQCGLPTPERQRLELETSSVVCLDNPDLIAETINFTKENTIENSRILSFFDNVLSGNSKIEFISYDSFGINSEKLSEISKETPYLTAKLTKAISLPDYFDASGYDALCVYEGYSSRKECAQKFQSELPSTQENILASGGWWQFSTTRQEQFEAKKKRAEEIIACTNVDHDPLIPCDQPYVVTRKTPWTTLMNKNVITSVDLANKIASMTYEDFLAEDPAMQMAILSLRESRAYSAVYLVVREVITNTTFVTKITNFFDYFDPVGPTLPPSSPEPTSPPNQSVLPNSENMVVKSSYIPGVFKTTARSEELYRLVNKKQAGNEGVDNINQNLKADLGEIDINDIETMIAAKIAASNLNCSNQTFTYQSSGSQEKYPAKTNPLSINFNLEIDVTLPWKQAINQNIANVYEAYLIAPTQKIAELIAQDDNSPLPMMVKKEYQQSAQEDTYIPHQLSDSPPEAHNYTTIPTTEPIPCAEGVAGPCFQTVEKEYGIEYNAVNDKKLEGPLPGGEATNWLLYLKGKFAWKKGTPEHYSGTCYANETADKLNSSLLTSLEEGLFALIGRADNSTNGQCPEELTKNTSQTSSLGNDVCEIAEQYQVDCNVLLAVWNIETGGANVCVPECWHDRSQCELNCPENYEQSFSSCNQTDSSPSGPLALNKEAADVDPSLNRCLIPDALGLAAQVLVELKNFGEPVTSEDLEPAGRYQGCNNCEPSDQTQYRWGEGVSYCDAVKYYIENGQEYPGTVDPSFDKFGLQCYPQ